MADTIKRKVFNSEMRGALLYKLGCGGRFLMINKALQQGSVPRVPDPGVPGLFY